MRYSKTPDELIQYISWISKKPMRAPNKYSSHAEDQSWNY
jgi:hypothetical protein